MSSLDALLEVALSAARAAAEIHHRRPRALDPTTSGQKGHSDWVTEVDHRAEEAAVAEIRTPFPDHAVAAEERDWGGPPPGSAEVTWYIDPLDGTTNYLHGYPVHSAAVAAVDSAGLAAAAVVNSGRWETFDAVRGGGARKDGHAIHVSRVSELRHALIGTGFPFKKLELLDAYLAQFRAILPRTSGIRRAGSAALDLCDLACGRLDGFWELHLASWDVAAGALILREAGGVITDLEGSHDVVKHGALVAGNPDVYRALRELINTPVRQ
jgi:myo-inositol-1(or 4)-monophosphatase